MTVRPCSSRGTVRLPGIRFLLVCNSIDQSSYAGRCGARRQPDLEHELRCRAVAVEDRPHEPESAKHRADDADNAHYDDGEASTKSAEAAVAGAPKHKRGAQHKAKDSTDGPADEDGEIARRPLKARDAESRSQSRRSSNADRKSQSPAGDACE
jgi:hypothetical protein